MVHLNYIVIKTVCQISVWKISCFYCSISLNDSEINQVAKGSKQERNNVFNFFLVLLLIFQVNSSSYANNVNLVDCLCQIKI